jgi:hypothetical protein
MQTHRQQVDIISLILFLKNEDRSLKIGIIKAENVEFPLCTKKTYGEVEL